MKKLKFFKGFARAATIGVVALTACTAAAGLAAGSISSAGYSNDDSCDVENSCVADAVPYEAISAFTSDNNSFATGAHAHTASAFDSNYYNPYSFEFTAFKVTYDVRSDRTMDVVMDLTVHYTGYLSTGFIHDIPVNSGDRVRNISAYEVNSLGQNAYLDYTIENDFAHFVSVNMGDESNKTNETHRYRIYYEYAITKPAEKNVLYLNAIGYGSEASISNVEITYKLPDGLKSAVYYMGIRSENNTAPYRDYAISEDGKTITLTKQSLSAYNGITFALTFEDGVLSTKTDLTPYYIIIAGCAALALLFATKFLIFNRDGLTPVVSVEAPNKMGPLVMGKLIDNKVDQSDVTSLIFYWADKGYLKINLDNPDNVELIRITQRLPESAPRHEKIMYNNLFLKGDLVKVNSLNYSFYSTVDTVTKEVNLEVGKLYDTKSMCVAILFAIVGALMMALTPIILANLLIGMGYSIISPLFIVVPSAVVFLVALNNKYFILKNSKKKTALLYLLAVVISVVCSVIYVLLVPSHIIETVPAILLCAVGFAIVILSTLIVSRTPAYTEKLNDIVGFREFILTAEKEKLEMMLEHNPELYYHILPYAIVLGVSDLWADKFKNISIAPPSWCTTMYHNRMFNFVVFHSTLNSVNTNMTSKMTSRPSSGSHSGGGHHGGGFGGHAGGGHGGGGFRGR